MSTLDNTNSMVQNLFETMVNKFQEEQNQMNEDAQGWLESKLAANDHENQNDIKYSFEEQFILEEQIIQDDIPTKKIYEPEDFIQVFNNNIYKRNHLSITNSHLYIKNFDVVITYGWTGINYGPVSAWYDAFELWLMVQQNTLPTDLGGRNIGLLFPDCPDTNSIIQILKSIFYKYTIDQYIFESFCKSVFFINQPEKLSLSLGQLPYKNYSPSNLVFVDGVLPKVELVADNIFIQTLGKVPEEPFKDYNYNFLLVYTDLRVHKLNEQNKIKYKKDLSKDLSIARAHYPNTVVYDDIRRVNFQSFRKFVPKENLETPYLDEEQVQPKKRFLLYVTPKNRSIYKTFHYQTGSHWSNQELDDILNIIPDSCLNDLALDLKSKQKDIYNYFKESNKKTNQKDFSDEQIAIIQAKCTIQANGYTANDVILEDPKAHLIIVGLTDENRGFEEALLARALTRGMNISTESYNQKNLPIKDIHSLYDYYIFTPPTRWTTTRFLPEAVYYKKKVLLTDKAKDTLKWNIPMALRFEDTMTYLMSVAEDDVFKKPKSKIANHLLNNWIS